MTAIELRKLEETDGDLVPGEKIGEILLEGESFNVSIEDALLRNRIESLIREGLTVLEGDPSGKRLITVARTVDMDDPRFVRALINRLEEKDFRLAVVFILLPW